MWRRKRPGARDGGPRAPRRRGAHRVGSQLRALRRTRVTDQSGKRGGRDTTAAPAVADLRVGHAARRVGRQVRPRGSARAGPSRSASRTAVPARWAATDATRDARPARSRRVRPSTVRVTVPRPGALRGRTIVLDSDPYYDAECECTVTTTYHAQVRGDTLSGTFATRGAGHGAGCAAAGGGAAHGRHGLMTLGDASVASAAAGDTPGVRTILLAGPRCSPRLGLALADAGLAPPPAAPAASLIACSDHAHRADPRPTPRRRPARTTRRSAWSCRHGPRAARRRG
jgi:hypothetical protein